MTLREYSAVAVRDCRYQTLTLLALTAVVLQAAPARAAVSAVLEWEAPEACPGASAVFARLSASLGYEPQTLGKLSRVRGDVVASGQGYRLSLEVTENGRRSSRWLEATSCDDLVDAAVLAITLALAPEGAPPLATSVAHADATSQGVASNAASLNIDADVRTDAMPSPTAPLTNGTRVPVRGVASLDMVVELGALPEAALGLSVSAGAQWLAWSLGVYGTLFRGQRLAVRSNDSVDFELSVAGLRGCRRWPNQTLLLDTCLELEAGRWEAFGTDLEAARRARDLWLAPGTALKAGIELTPTLTLQMGAAAALPLTRKHYTINAAEEVHTPDPVSWRFTAGLVLSTR